MRATLDESDDVAKATKELQARAEGLVEDHKNGLLSSIRELYDLTERQQEMRGLQKQLQQAQDRIQEIRTAHPGLVLTNGEKSTDQPEDQHLF